MRLATRIASTPCNIIRNAVQNRKSQKSRSNESLVVTLRRTRCAQVFELYRKRFGIEISYRQMDQVLVRTISRKPTSRLLLVGLALVLVNLRLYCPVSRVSFLRCLGVDMTVHFLLERPP